MEMEFVGDDPTGQIKGGWIEGMGILFKLPPPWIMNGILSFPISCRRHRTPAEREGRIASPIRTSPYSVDLEVYLDSPLKEPDTTQFYFLPLMRQGIAILSGLILCKSKHGDGQGNDSRTVSYRRVGITKSNKLNSKDYLATLFLALTYKIWPSFGDTLEDRERWDRLYDGFLKFVESEESRTWDFARNEADAGPGNLYLNELRAITDFEGLERVEAQVIRLV